ncbi:Polysaccharide export ATP-binding protein [Granulibacter bethesdensis]|uniref:Polysaccharide export ATP-binding protein n=2 Tax=Granulibacter bethesdensis TaxID=364410 RepID=Q0BR35_GRABC|nr:Polysaccharide export ATP-binding protein [Granulibacter bethesdensis CGDNIH1]AHJ68341.1 Polysaccharide export ATP-binding protein [Granulibacter bethesdensis]APH52576.1 Polysaccharide export ATP-binding protein [Granulibacter bethesdensis]APH65265.1 Polysaccharide export ATP-binding protein [Granulibacter bethesdensis]
MDLRPCLQHPAVHRQLVPVRARARAHRILDLTNMAFLEARNVGVDFPLYHGNARSLKRAVFNAASAGRFGQDARKRTVVQALQDISFTLRPGDRLGLVGSNGAGKTTLLRVLAGIYEPTTGSVRASGTINALLDTTMGTNSDLSGHDNIRLRGMYSGLSRDEITALEKDVETFADLKEFMHLPMRVYSSGMTIRLAFGLATSIRPQILLMDEWFSAGDFSFMSRAKARMEGLVRDSEILVLSSHSHDTVAEWCNRVIWMDQGRIVADGAPKDVLEAYLGRPLKEAERADAFVPS